MTKNLVFVERLVAVVMGVALMLVSKEHASVAMTTAIIVVLLISTGVRLLG